MTTSNPGSINPGSIDAVRQMLATPDGFAKGVSASRGVRTIGIVCLVLGVAGIAMNLFQLGSASDWNWSLMFQFFFDAEAIEFSGYRSSRSEVWRYIYVWGPVVLLPLGIILLIVHFATKDKAGAGLYADFQQRGWVGHQRKPGLQVKNGNAKVDIALISHPSVPDQVFETASQRYAAYLGSLDASAMKEVAKHAFKQKVIAGTTAAALSPEFPPAVVAAQAQGDAPLVAVIPPKTPGKGGFKIMKIKV